MSVALPHSGQRAPAKFEFDLLAFLGAHDGLTVREVHEQFGAPRGYVRGTIVKGLDRMMRKHLVERELRGATYAYRSTESTEVLERRLVESFVQERLTGSLAPLAAYFASESARAIPNEELLALKEAIEGALKSGGMDEEVDWAGGSAGDDSGN